MLWTTASASPTTISHPFHPLSKVLFIFPSRYLFAIGLLPIFSLRCDLPPALGCIPKQPDSSAGGRQLVSLRHGALTLSGAAFQQTHTATPISPARLHSTTPIAGFPKLSSSRFTRRYWGNHCYFLLLRLLICLSSAGRLACLRPDWSLSRVLPHDNRGAFHRAARPAPRQCHSVSGPQPHMPTGTRCVQIPNVSHMQVTLLFAPCCVLHRCKSPEIHC